MTRQTTTVLKAATVLGLLPSIMVALAVFSPGPDLVSSRGYYLGQDFVNFWTGGRLALQGQVESIYDRQTFDAVVSTWFAPANGPSSFSYPPHLLPLLAVLALLPYGAALVLWQTLGLGLFLLVSLVGTRKGTLELLPYLILSPIAVLVITVGQASFFLAAVFVGSLRVMPERPLTGGILLGLLTFKPQLGILLPLVLIMLGQWRTFAAAAITTFVLVGLSAALFGLVPWQDYFLRTLPFQQRVLTEMVGLYPSMMVTPYAEFWWLGISAPIALGLHALLAAAISAVALIACRGPADPHLKITILALAAVMVPAYCLNYDLAIPAAAVVLWTANRPEPLAKPTLSALGLFWALPYFAMALVLWHMPVMPILVLALFLAVAAEGWRPSGFSTRLLAVAK